MKGNGFGMLVGAEMLHPVTTSLAIKANAGYKLFTNIKILKIKMAMRSLIPQFL